MGGDEGWGERGARGGRVRESGMGGGEECWGEEHTRDTLDAGMTRENVLP